MIERVDIQEIKKLTVFLAVVIGLTLVIGLIVKGLKDVRPNIEKTITARPNFADEADSQNDVLKMENYELYQLRDPFTPLAIPEEPQRETNLAAGNLEPLPKVVKVYLQGSREKAKVIYRGKPKILRENQTIGSFKVVDIITTSKKAVFIYGDEKVVVREKPAAKIKPKISVKPR